MKRLIQQFFNFAVVGGISTLIDFIVLYISYETLGMNYLIGTAIAFIIATVFNYWASMRFIFVSKFGKDQRYKEFTIFLSLSIVGLILTQILMFVFVEWFGVAVMISKIFVTGFVMIFNFVSRKILLDDSSEDEPINSVHTEKVAVKEANHFDK